MKSHYKKRLECVQQHACVLLPWRRKPRKRLHDSHWDAVRYLEIGLGGGVVHVRVLVPVLVPVLWKLTVY